MDNKCVVLIPAFEPRGYLIDLVQKISDTDWDTVIINDGSGREYDDVFKECEKYARVISYSENGGKGYALKTGFKYIQEKYIDNYYVITMDADGQHTINDALRLYELCKKHPNTLIIGKRVRGKNVPIRSKIGNSLTSFIFKLKTGRYIYDTQSGLRVFSYKLMEDMLSVDGERYEYEINVLLWCIKNKIPIKESEVSTIYLDNNSDSHFNVFRDSYQIYKELFKYRKRKKNRINV